MATRPAGGSGSPLDDCVRFPRLRARFEAVAVDYAAAPDNTFEFGPEVILDGLEARLVTP